MFHLTLLDPKLSPHLSTPFPAHAHGSSTSPSLFYPSASPSTATLQGASCFGRVAEQPISCRVAPTGSAPTSRDKRWNMSGSDNAEMAVQGENGKADEQLSGEESM